MNENNVFPDNNAAENAAENYSAPQAVTMPAEDAVNPVGTAPAYQAGQADSPAHSAPAASSASSADASESGFAGQGYTAPVPPAQPVIPPAQAVTPPAPAPSQVQPPVRTDAPPQPNPAQTGYTGAPIPPTAPYAPQGYPRQPYAPPYNAGQPVYGQPVYGHPQYPNYGYPTTPTAPQNRTGNGLGTASMVCGIISIVMFWPFGFILGLLGIIFGAVARSKGLRNGQTIAGIVTGSFGLALFLLILLVLVAVISEEGNITYYYDGLEMSLKSLLTAL
jgi:hypothetical protein